MIFISEVNVMSAFNSVSSVTWFFSWYFRVMLLLAIGCVDLWLPLVAKLIFLYFYDNHAITIIGTGIHRNWEFSDRFNFWTSAFKVQLHQKKGPNTHTGISIITNSVGANVSFLSCCGMWWRPLKFPSLPAVPHVNTRGQPRPNCRWGHTSGMIICPPARRWFIGKSHVHWKGQCTPRRRSPVAMHPDDKCVTVQEFRAVLTSLSIWNALMLLIWVCGLVRAREEEREGGRRREEREREREREWWVKRESDGEEERCGQK